MQGAIERFPPTLFLRETPLTAPDPAIAAFAAETKQAAGTIRWRSCMPFSQPVQCRDGLRYRPDPAGTTATEAFALKRGVCQDLTHIFIACRAQPRRSRRAMSAAISTALTASTEQDAGHAWAEAYVDDLGWVAFDPANGICATDAHVRVAVGLDYLGAAPVRGTRYGGGDETLTVRVVVDQSHAAGAKLSCQHDARRYKRARTFGGQAT